MRNRTIAVILNLDVIIQNWDKLSSDGYIPELNVNTYSGVCVNAGFIRTRHGDAVAASVKDFANVKGTTVGYPVGGYTEYQSSGLYRNPNRKEFTYWLRDNLEWSLTWLERKQLKLIRRIRKITKQSVCKPVY